MTGSRLHLREQYETIIDALRHAGDLLLRDRDRWEKTVWVDSEEDARSLQRLLRDPVASHCAALRDHPVATFLIVQPPAPDPAGSPAGRQWGVRMSLRRP